MSPENRFRAYISAFNRSDWPALCSHYAPDVVLVIGNGTELVGHDAIVSFYRRTKCQTQRTIEIVRCVAGEELLAAELQSEFLALEDVPDFGSRPLARGDRLWINSFVWYESVNGLYRRIRSAVFRREHRPAQSTA